MFVFIGDKECIKCKVPKPYNKEYFYSNKSLKYGLDNICKVCKREVIKEYKRNNREKINKTYSEYKKKNRDYFNVCNQKRRSRQKKLAASFTLKDWQDALKSFNHSCAYCGSTAEIQQEHYIPVASGGAYTKDNIIPACATCNMSKNDKNIIEWYKTKSYYAGERMDKIIGHLIVTKWGS